MRDLRTKLMVGGSIADISGAGTTPKKAIPIHCELMGAAVAVSAAVDADNSFDVMKNGADTGVDLVIPDTLTGAMCQLDDRLWFVPGDAIEFQGNSETSVAAQADFTLVLKPTESPSS